MSGAVTLRFSSQAQMDIRRIGQELAETQRQIATGARADDLLGFGASSGRLINARGMRAAAEARASVLSQLDARFGVQGAALGQVAGAASHLALTIREALAANDGRGIGDVLPAAFSTMVSALNEQWNGQPLFAGERTSGAGPVQVGTLAELRAAAVPSEWFEEAARAQVIDLGAGAPEAIADKASDLASPLFQTVRLLSDLVEGMGGAIGSPINLIERNQLQNLADQLDAGARAFNNAEGRTGQMQKRVEEERIGLQARSDLLTKQIGEQADADLAEVSMRLSALMTQYEAAAKTFADLSQLSLLRYL